MLTFGRFKSLIDGARSSHGRSVNAPIEEQHHQHRQIEGAERRVNNVARIVGQLAGQRTRRARLVIRHVRRSGGEQDERVVVVTVVAFARLRHVVNRGHKDQIYGLRLKVNSKNFCGLIYFVPHMKGFLG